ncbi:asparagine-tRNA ligase [Vittaforma corneae ATCC 50505]|uniref:asparagine--tRNA ligase n=1 Tax=Vittaforma corneae (strain ATCC 50505) TaxID=993615 RepID=L2GKP1_VITCO|nr:asparagine-tRNA ligase [Vittaforma corneae ATCC 50505]ELA41070.1 asparagine-tRNA ligase [Vittaforma corneae ATCC 50505]
MLQESKIISKEDPTISIAGKSQEGVALNESALSEGVEKMKLVDINESEYERVRLEEISLSLKDRKIKTFGWVTKSTSVKSRCFFHLSSAFSTVKCVVEGDHGFTFQTSLTIYGTVVEPVKRRDEFLFEIAVDKYEIYNSMPAPTFPLNAQSEKETRLDNGHLALRMKDRELFVKARSTLLHLMREYYFKNKYTEITPPTLVQTQVEGGATLFSLDYYGEKAYLTQSSQLYLETVAPVVGKAYCIMPSYRAEKSKTSRHLSEFTHVEAELVDVSFSELMDSIEGLVRYSITEFYKTMLEDIQKVVPDFVPVTLSEKPFKKLSYRDAIEYLRSKNHLKPDGTAYEYMDDIADASEKFICAEYGVNQPVFLTHFPHALKSFYMKKIDGDLTESCDLLFPAVGETVGGSMRLDNYQQLVDAFKNEGIAPGPYYWYLDMARYGPSKHGGYGLGFERLLMALMKYKNVDESCIYPRKVSRCQP